MSFLASKLKDAAAHNRNKVAFIHGDKTTTYGEFYDRSVRLSNAFASLNLKKGDRIAQLMPNCVPAVELDAACIRQGLVRVPLNARLSPQEILGMLENADVHCLMTTTAFVDAFNKAGVDLTQLSSLKSIYCTDTAEYEQLLADADTHDTFVELDDDDLYALFFTSGTSGVLKAAMTSHKNWKALVRYSSANQPSSNVVNAFVAPITHAAGAAILPSMLRGGKNILLNGFDPEGVLKLIQDHRVTNLLLVPTMLNMMMQVPDADRYDLSSLYTVVYGTAPFAPDRIEGAVKLFGPVLRQGYGQTECCGMISSLEKDDHLGVDDPMRYERLGSAGKPIFDAQVRVVDEQGRDVPVGETGEIILKGDSVMLGYWRAPELTAETLIDGWLYTRDMGRFDEAGYLYLVDRKSDMIITGGYNVYPKEVENALSTHPAVFECAVVGVPDEKWGESIKAVVVLRPNEKASEREIIDHCKSTLASMKKPSSVDFVDDLPKSAVGKILRRKVKEQYWTGQSRRVN